MNTAEQFYIVVGKQIKQEERKKNNRYHGGGMYHCDCDDWLTLEHQNWHAKHKLVIDDYGLKINLLKCEISRLETVLGDIQAPVDCESVRFTVEKKTIAQEETKNLEHELELYYMEQMNS